jgi:4-amino-4-deoxy-L-arabinose transferase-like glycosyltransferase
LTDIPTHSRPWPVWAWVAVALAGVALLLLAGLFPEADTPSHLPAGLGRVWIQEFVVEAPAKAHEARNWALFGEWHRNPADNYQFWRVQAPVWVYPLAWLFRVFGVSYTTLRMFSLAFGMAGFIGFALLLRRTLPAWAGVAAAWLYASNLFAVLMARVGMIEVLLNTAAVWMVLALIPARRHPGWLVLSQVLFLVAFFGKQGIVYLFPLLVGANVLAFLGWRRDRRFERLRWLPVATAVGIALFTIYFVLQPEYLRTLAWNFDHMLSGSYRGTVDGVAWWDRFDLRRLWRSMMVMTPVVGVFGLPGLLWLAWSARRERTLPWTRGLVLAWYASGWFAVFAGRTWTIRHTSILLIPGFIVMMWVLVTVLRASRVNIRPLVGAVLIIALGVNISHQVRRYEELSWARKEVADGVVAAIGDRPATIIGRFAMPYLLSTPYDIFYVKEAFNVTEEAIDALAPTHLLLTRYEGTDKLLKEFSPSYYNAVECGHFFGNRMAVTLFALTEPGAAECPPPGPAAPR